MRFKRPGVRYSESPAPATPYQAAAQVWDDRLGRLMNASLADYLMPVNADLQSVEALFVPENDRHLGPLGVKGLAEIAVVGVAPAIVNAIYNATGRRIRSLPVTPDKILGLS